MAQKTAWTGAALTESDINAYLMHEGGAWTAFTPTLTQSATVTKTVTSAHYARSGRLIIANIVLAVTGAGTASNAILIGLPVAAIANLQVIGSGSILDSSASTTYGAQMVQTTTTTAAFLPGGGVLNYLGAAQMTAALASGDVVTCTFMYEAAS